MSKTEAPPAPTTLNVVMAEKTHRDSDTVMAELLAARDLLHELHRQAEADRIRVAEDQANWDSAVVDWRKRRGDAPFNPSSFHLPPQRAVANDDLCRRWHKQHYAVAKLENELEGAKSAEVRA